MYDHTTFDRDGSRLFTTQQIGETQELTPEGYLVCYDVPIARAGSMLYAFFELPFLKPDAHGQITVLRSDEDLFDPDTIASVEGKDITIDHPNDKLNPESWQSGSYGVVLNVRRGEGEKASLLLADLIIKDARAIKAVQDKEINEVSLGYDARYEQDDQNPGFARQRNIRGNHVALVKRGRCGPVCSIGDHAMPQLTLKERIMRAFYSRDADELSDAVKGIPDEDASNKEKTGTTDAENGKGAPPGADPADETNNGKGGTRDAEGAESDIERRVGSLEKKVDQILEKLSTKDAEGGGGNRTEEEEERERVRKAATQDKGKGTKDAGSESEVEGGEKANLKEGHREKMGEGDKATKDSRYEFERFRQVVADAEIIAPGMTAPTFDASMSLANTNDAICKFKRAALRQSFTKDGADVIKPFLQGKPITTLDSMPCEAVDMLFHATVDGITRKREASYKKPILTTAAQQTKDMSPAAINKRNREFWDARR